jgi:hypothetical protein
VIGRLGRGDDRLLFRFELGIELGFGGGVEHLVRVLGTRRGLDQRRRHDFGHPRLDDLFGKCLPGPTTMGALHLPSLRADGLRRHLVARSAVRADNDDGLGLGSGHCGTLAACG